MKENIENIVETVGERVRLLRTQQGKTLERLAMESGIGLQTLKQLEKGKTSCYITTLYAVASVLGVSADFLLGRRQGAESQEIALLVESLPKNDQRILLYLARRMKASENFDITEILSKE